MVLVSTEEVKRKMEPFVGIDISLEQRGSSQLRAVLFSCKSIIHGSDVWRPNSHLYCFSPSHSIHFVSFCWLGLAISLDTTRAFN